MLFNLVAASVVTIALVYACYVVLLFVRQAIDTGYLPNWNYVRYDEPGKYWSGLTLLSVLAVLCGATAAFCGLWIVPFCWTHLSG
jgi:hypothetical protein